MAQEKPQDNDKDIVAHIEGIDVDGFTLFSLGMSLSKRTVYRHLPGTDLALLKAVFPSSGWEYGCHQLSNLEWAFGWTKVAELVELVKQIPKSPLIHKVTIEVKSDSDPKNTKYNVLVDKEGLGDMGQPLSCTCKAGEHGKPCKHLHRGLVVATDSLKQAAQKMVDKGNFKNMSDFWLYFRKKADNIGINLAICKAIEEGLGSKHPHTVDYATHAKNAAKANLTIEDYIKKNT